MPGIELRTANDVFMNEMQNFTTLIVDMMKQEKLFASQGGPIIIAQVFMLIFFLFLWFLISYYNNLSETYACIDRE